MAISSNRILNVALIVNIILLTCGLTVCLIDLDQYSWGLYMVLVAIVGLIVCMAFCLLGGEDEVQPLAKKMWTHMATRRMTVVLHPGLTVVNPDLRRYSGNYSDEHSRSNY